MTDEPTYTAFAGDRLLASGAKPDVLRALKAREGGPERVLVFEDATGRQVDLDGTKIAVFWDGARWFAVDDTCPHMGASLSDGRLFGDQLQCSWHEWRYDTTTGRCPLRPAMTPLPPCRPFL